MDDKKLDDPDYSINKNIIKNNIYNQTITPGTKQVDTSVSKSVTSGTDPKPVTDTDATTTAGGRRKRRTKRKRHSRRRRTIKTKK